jgi:hypothetical protein
MSALSATASSRSRACRLAGAALLVLVGLAAPADAQRQPGDAAQPAYQNFHSHVGWRAPAVAANDARQVGASWTALPSRIARSNGNWQPTLLPGETATPAVRRDPNPGRTLDGASDLNR